jgi:hypothetical protein
LEALHTNPFVWLLCESVCDLVHLLDHSLIAEIESNDSPDLDFMQQQQGQTCKCICMTCRNKDC